MATIPEVEVDPLRCLAELLESQAVLLRAVATARDKAREAEDARDPDDGASMNIRAAALRLGVSARFIGNAVRRGELQAQQLGPRLYRIYPRALEAFRKRRNLMYAVLR